MDKDALRKLIEAVEAGALPDEDWRLMHDIWSPRNWHEIGHNVRYSMHGSIDAAKALHEALVPGWAIERIRAWPSCKCSIDLWKTSEPDGNGDRWHHRSDGRVEASNPDLARAWLLAILKAVEAQP